MMLSVRAATKLFGGLAALRDVSFDLAKGEIKAVIGPNGAGKTTMFHLITGILRPTSGRIEFAGRSVEGLSALQIARLGIARTFQQPQIFRSLTVLENVMLGADRSGRSGLLACGLGLPRTRLEERRQIAAAHEYLAFTGMADHAQRIASDLPLGEQRYVEITRALATGASLLLLDEPAAGLDETETEQLSALILRIRDRGTTVLLIEHHMKFVMGIADSVLVLNFGAWLADGTPAEVRSSPAVIDAYLGTAENA